MRATLLLFLVFAGFINSSARLIWTITDANGQVSYILGSNHLATSGAVENNRPLMQVLSDIDILISEIDISEMENEEGTYQLLRHAIAPADSSLAELLTDAERNKIEDLMTRYGKNADDALLYMPYKPAMLEDYLGILRYDWQNKIGDDVIRMDNYLQSYAMDEGISLIALETIEQQCKYLFGSPISEQLKSLKEVLDDNIGSERQSAELKLLYDKEDIEGLLNLTVQQSRQDDLERLLYGRNRLWLPVILDAIKSGKVLICVGAAHLPGPQGLISLLRAEGYSVEPLSR